MGRYKYFSIYIDKFQPTTTYNFFRLIHDVKASRQNESNVTNTSYVITQPLFLMEVRRMTLI